MFPVSASSGENDIAVPRSRFTSRLPGTYPHDAQLDCRVGGGGSEHYRTIEAPEFSIDPQKKIIPTLDKLLRKRNIGSHDDYGFTVETCCE
jgi:hypothetical protein